MWLVFFLKKSLLNILECEFLARGIEKHNKENVFVLHNVAHIHGKTVLLFVTISKEKGTGIPLANYTIPKGLLWSLLK